MNRRNLLLLAAVWSAIVLGTLVLLAGDQTWIAGILYWPGIVAGIVISHFLRRAGHAPEATAVWTGAVVWSLLYWAVLIAIYALLLEWYLLRSAGNYLDASTPESDVAGKGTADTHLAHFGTALKLLEKRRRSHWLLAPIPGLNLADSPERFASAALRTVPRHRAVNGLLRRFEGHMAGRSTPEEASLAVDRMRNRAQATG